MCLNGRQSPTKFAASERENVSEIGSESTSRVLLYFNATGVDYSTCRYQATSMDFAVSKAFFDGSLILRPVNERATVYHNVIKTSISSNFPNKFIDSFKLSISFTSFSQLLRQIIQFDDVIKFSSNCNRLYYIYFCNSFLQHTYNI